MGSRHGNVADTLGALGLLVADHLSARHFAVVVEEELQLRAIHCER